MNMVQELQHNAETPSWIRTLSHLGLLHVWPSEFAKPSFFTRKAKKLKRPATLLAHLDSSCPWYDTVSFVLMVTSVDRVSVGVSIGISLSVVMFYLYTTTINQKNRVLFLSETTPPQVDSLETEIAQIRKETRELEMQLADASSPQETKVPPQIQQSIKILESQLIEKFVEFAAKGLESRVLSREDQDYVEAIWGFYFKVFAPFLFKSYPEAIREPQYCTLIAHAGSQKWDYAIDLFKYLEQGGRAVFIDARSIAPGSHPTDEILQAAISCRYYWCVATKEFMTRKHTLREYLIGCCRFIEAKRTDRFKIIIDCLETDEKTGGRWMEQLLNCPTFRPSNGETSINFPGQMQRTRYGESYDERRRRIAHEFEIVHHDKSPCQVTQVPVHPYFRPDIFRPSLEKANKVFMLHSYPALPHTCEGSLKKAFRNGADIRLLMMDPTSQAASQRNHSLGDVMEIVQLGIDRDIRFLEKILRSSPPDSRGQIQVRSFTVTPPFCMFLTDKTAFVGLFWVNGMVSSKPHFHIEESKSDWFFAQVMEQFDVIWSQGKELQWNGNSFIRPWQQPETGPIG